MEWNAVGERFNFSENSQTERGFGKTEE